MAIVAKNLYPTRVITGADGFPLGKAKDIVDGVEGTGTPLKATWVNDQWGFLQALLDYSSITPSGVPDQVGASQYLEAIIDIARKQLTLKIFQSPTNNLTEIKTVTPERDTVFEVRSREDNNLVTIYSDSNANTELVQDGVSNVSDANAECSFFVKEGAYYLTSSTQTTSFDVITTQQLDKIAIFALAGG